jgi:hypothetical protein
MSAQPEHNPSVRRVMLPSGKTIEVVYFPPEDAPPVPPVSPVRQPVKPLHVCHECDSELVYPVAWQEASETSWELDLRCPNCEWTHTGVYGQEAVDEFDRELDDGTDALVRDLRRLAHANMEDEVDTFIRALEADAILPEDFDF